MKAKDLAKILLQNPNAEVITQEYFGDDFIVGIEHAQLYQKGSKIDKPRRSYTGAVEDNGKCKVDVIYIGSTKR